MSVFSQSQAKTIASLLLILMALSNVVHVIFPAFPLWISGVSTWLALGLIIFRAPRQPFTQFFALSGVGLILLLIAYWRGAHLVWSDIVLQNNGLVCLLYGVGFLRLITLATQDKNQTLPQGKLAFLQTLLGVHLLGAVINMSILVLMAERLYLNQALTKQAVIVLTRGFSTAAYWSPFFAAMAVALSYAPNANLMTILVYGMALASLALSITILELGGFKLDKVKDFRGYPVHLSSLTIPALLAITVLILHKFLPTLPVLTVIGSTAVILSISFTCYKQRQKAITLIKTHITHSGQRMARELSLFMGAGLLSIGVQLFFNTLTNWHPFTTFSAWQFSGLLAITIIISIIGVHPVVSIAVIASLLQPLHPDPTLLAILCLSIWSLGVVASPFSGVNTVLGSQFQIKAYDLINGNRLYVSIMWLNVTLLSFLFIK